MRELGNVERGVVIGTDAYTPFYPVATAQPIVADASAVTVVQGSGMVPLLPAEQEMQRA